MVALSPMIMMREPSMMMVIVLSAALATPATAAQTRNILGRQLQHHGSGKGLQTETESIQPESIQTGTAKTPVCAKI